LAIDEGDALILRDRLTEAKIKGLNYYMALPQALSTVEINRVIYTNGHKE